MVFFGLWKCHAYENGNTDQKLKKNHKKLKKPSKHPKNNLTFNQNSKFEKPLHSPFHLSVPEYKTDPQFQGCDLGNFQNSL